MSQFNGTEHSISYEIGYLLGASEAKASGVLPKEDVEAMSIACYQESKRSMVLDMLDFCRGYQVAYADHLSGLC